MSGAAFHCVTLEGLPELHLPCLAKAVSWGPKEDPVLLSGEPGRSYNLQTSLPHPHSPQGEAQASWSRKGFQD